LDAISRGRADLALRDFSASWPTWRGRSVEPLVHDALSRLLPETDEFHGVERVGSWWTRDGQIEVDVTATSRGQTVAAIGSIKWRERGRFSGRDLSDLAQARALVPHAEHARLIAVCPAGVATGVRPDLALNARDLLAAWRA
jgi:hypothetical protein